VGEEQVRAAARVARVACGAGEKSKTCSCTATSAARLYAVSALFLAVSCSRRGRRFARA
jgi:hypothetical protein